MKTYKFEKIDWNEEFTNNHAANWFLNNLWIIGALEGLDAFRRRNRKPVRKHRTRYEIETDLSMTEWERQNELDEARMDGEAWD